MRVCRLPAVAVGLPSQGSRCMVRGDGSLHPIPGPPQAVEKLEHYLGKKGRPGLQIGLRRLVGELTLLGFVSLILILFQESLTNICGRA